MSCAFYNPSSFYALLYNTWPDDERIHQHLVLHLLLFLNVPSSFLIKSRFFQAVDDGQECIHSVSFFYRSNNSQTYFNHQNFSCTSKKLVQAHHKISTLHRFQICGLII